MQKCWLKKMAYRIAGPKYFNPKKGWSKELLVKTIGQKTILSKKICQKFSQNLLIQKILVNKLQSKRNCQIKFWNKKFG